MSAGIDVNKTSRLHDCIICNISTYLKQILNFSQKYDMVMRFLLKEMNPEFIFCVYVRRKP